VRLDQARLEAHRLLHLTDGRGRSTGHFRQGEGKVVVGFGIVWLETQSRFVVGNGVGPPAGQLGQGIGEVVVRLGIIRRNAQRRS